VGVEPRTPQKVSLVFVDDISQYLPRQPFGACLLR